MYISYGVLLEDAFGGFDMENYYYKCEICGYTHIVPAYWVSYNPEKNMEFPHVNIESKEDCTNSLLVLIDTNQ